MASSQADIQELEKNLALGDIVAASRTFVRIYDCWNELDAATQKDLKTLEAIFISMVKIQSANNAGQ